MTGGGLHLKQIEPRPIVLVDTTAWAAALVAPDLGSSKPGPARTGSSNPGSAETGPPKLGSAALGLCAVLCLGHAATARPIIMELLSLFEVDEERREMQERLESLPVVRVTEEVWANAASLARQVRHAGLLVPSMRVLVAAIAMTYDLQLMHADPRLVAVCDIARLKADRVSLAGSGAPGPD